MIKYYCDICKKEVPYIALYSNYIAKGDTKNERRIECCEDCTKKIDTYIRGITNKE